MRGQSFFHSIHLHKESLRPTPSKTLKTIYLKTHLEHAATDLEHGSTDLEHGSTDLEHDKPGARRDS